MRRPVLAVLLAVVCALWASPSAANEASSMVRVRLSVKEPARTEGVGEVRAGGVLRLRVEEPGRLEVRVGGQVVAASYLGWGEDTRLRVEEVEEGAPGVLPRVVNGQPGREEVEVALPEEVEGAAEWGEVRYTWAGRHEGKPALERKWRLVAGEEQAAAQAFEEEFPLGERAAAELEAEAVRARGHTSEESTWLEALPLQVEANEPQVLWVSAYASRAEVAEQLFGEARAVEGFDYEACEEKGGTDFLPACVRVRQVELLRPAVRAEVRRALESLLEKEAAWLRGWKPGEAQAQAVVEHGLAWAQRAEVRDERGRSYFDRYLSLLADKRVEGEWDFLGRHSEQLKKAVALRAEQWKTGYRVTDGVPGLRPGEVVGRCYFNLHVPARRVSVAVRVMKLLMEERSQARAELRLRNTPWRGLRALVPGEDGRFRGYAVDLENLTEAEPLEQAGARLYGYYAGTLFIRPGEWRPAVEGRGDGEEGLRRELLERALASARKEQWEALLGLDHEVLGLLTAKQRQEILKRALAGPALSSALGEEVVELLARVVVSTPEEDFAALEQALTRQEVLKRLLRLEGAPQALLGQAFTRKALAAAPLPLESMEALPSFHLGREGEESYLLDVPLEHPQAGETLLRFRQVRQRFEARYLSSTEQEPLSRALRAREWVRVELHGTTPQIRLMTALELALSASEGHSALVWAAVGRVSEMHLLYGGVSAPARASLGAGAAVEGSAAAAAQRAAVKVFAERVALVAVLATVDSHRGELSRTPVGRDFLAVHDLALLVLAARDVSKLASSGLVREWARRGGTVLSQLGGKASAGLRESMERAQALARAVERVLAEGKALATGEGLTFATPEGARALRHAFFAVRGEMAAERALVNLRGAGVATAELERTLNTLRSLGEQSEAWAQAWSAVARRAAALPAQQARQYLEAVELLRTGARPAAQSAVAKLLRSSGSLPPGEALTFLKDAEWLVRRPGLEEEALKVLARKADSGKLDLRWLGSTSLATEDLNFLARDENTPWTLFKRAAEQPDNLVLQLQARRLLRGIAGEIVTERTSRELFPGYKVSGRQVPLEDGHIIDFDLKPVRGLTRRALEVKGWVADTWRRALNAWLHAKTGMSLPPREKQLLQSLERLIEQLKDAANAPRGKPFLVCTNGISQPTMKHLLKLLKEHSLEADIVMLDEAEMVATTRRLHAAFKLPEGLPGKATGGKP